MADQTDWYYKCRGGQQAGPISGVALRQLAQAGTLAQSDFVWHSGMKEWVPAARVRGLFTEAGENGVNEVGETGTDVGDDVLDQAESLLRRMIAGVFWFAFARLPLWVYRWLTRLSPLAVKLVRLAVLFAVWIVLVGGPVIVCERSESVRFDYSAFAAKTGLPIMDYEWLESVRLYRSLAWAWGIIAMTGSIWGVFYIRRRLRKRRSSQETHRVS